MSQEHMRALTVADIRRIHSEYGVAMPAKTRKPGMYAVAKRLKRATSITDNYLAQSHGLVTPAQRRRVKKAHGRSAALVTRYGVAQ